MKIHELRRGNELNDRINFLTAGLLRAEQTEVTLGGVLPFREGARIRQQQVDAIKLELAQAKKEFAAL